MNDRKHEPRSLLTVQEVARLLHVSDDTVRRQIKEGQLGAVRIGTTPTGRARYRIPSGAVRRILDGVGVGDAQGEGGHDPVERLRAVFAVLSDEDREAVVERAVLWARERQGAGPEKDRHPEPSGETLRKQFGAKALRPVEKTS